MTIKQIFDENKANFEACPLWERQAFIAQVFKAAGGSVWLGVPAPYSVKVNILGATAYINFGDKAITLELLGGRPRGFKTPELLESIQAAGGPEALAEALEVDIATLRRWDKKPLTKVIRLALAGLRK